MNHYCNMCARVCARFPDLVKQAKLQACGQTLACSGTHTVQNPIALSDNLVAIYLAYPLVVSVHSFSLRLQLT